MTQNQRLNDITLTQYLFPIHYLVTTDGYTITVEERKKLEKMSKEDFLEICQKNGWKATDKLENSGCHR